MKRHIVLALMLTLLAVAPSFAAPKAPTVADFKRVFEAQLQKLKPTGYTVRTVLFQDVRPGRPNGGYYPFQVTAIIHDYGPGYPANNFYGATCVAKMDKYKFDMRQDEFGDWIVQGRFTVPMSDTVCKDNPAEGVSSMPLAGLPGKTVSSTAPPPAKRQAAPAAQLYIGEYACYGTGGRLMAGMGFMLKPGGKYTDLDGARSGTYVYNAGAATITFRGGFLGGQVGRNVSNTGFDITRTVRAEPWR